ncbi:MAG TPA: hypothetical protein VF260_12070 [Bacilli bacterium]
MDPNNEDKKLRDRLSADPTGEPGFTERLRARIEEKVRRETRKKRRKWLLLGKAACISAAILIMLYYQPAGKSLLPQRTPTSDTLAGESAKTISVTPYARPQISDALLLGLRSGNPAAYRTLLIAPEGGKLQIAAQGNDILLPYKIEFWKIVTETRATREGTIRYVAAYPAEEAGKAVRHSGAEGADLSTGRILHDERLSFVGNKYLSLEMLRDRGQAYPNYRVETVTQLRGTGTDEMPARLLGKREPFVSLSGMLAIHDAYSDSDWGIVRGQGKWSAIAKRNGKDLSLESDGYRTINAKLLESVVSHDDLAVPWSTVRKLRPDASDALTSPDHDLLAIVSEQEISFFQINGNVGTEPLLIVPLQNGEKLIMAQWATGNYVAKWIKQTRKYLEGR